MASTWIKYVALQTFIVFLIIVGVLIAFFGPNRCERRECIEKAMYIKANMRTEIKPCDDFFDFACGNYQMNVEQKGKSILYNKKGYSTVLTRIKFDVQSLISDFMKKRISVTDDRILKLIKKMNQPCISSELIEKQGVKPMWDAIWSIGGVPVVLGDEWNDNDFELGDVESRTRKAGFSGQQIFQAFISEDEKRPGKFAIHITPPEFSEHTPGSELVVLKMSEDLRFNYLSYIVRLTFFLLSKKMGNTYEQDSMLEVKDHFDKELNKTLNLKLSLYESLKEYWAEQDPTNLYNLMTLDDLQLEFPYVKWKKFFERMLPSPEKVPKKIVVLGTTYFKSIKKVLETTERRTIANYLMVENFIEASLFLPDVYFSIYGKFLYRIHRNDRTKGRSVFCEKVVQKLLKAAISSLFVQTYNLSGLGSQKTLDSIAEGIQGELKKSLETLKWMDEKTKEQAYLKLHNVKFRLSLSDDQLNQLSDEEARAEYYEDLCLGRRLSHVLPSYFCVNQFHLRRNWELLERTPTAFDMHVTTVFDTEFTYDQRNNEIQVPYGLLKFPIFNDNWPTYLKYGGVGSILGEVFTHGYDTMGANRNYLGFRKHWWTDKTGELYREQMKCFGEKYKKFTFVISNSTVSDVTFVPEYLANFEGINLASRAYSKYAEKSFLQEQSLPGLEQFTPAQLHYIAFANEYCSHYTSGYYKYLLKIKNLPIFNNKYKVDGSLSNLQKFSDAFNCSIDEKMNENKKCTFLW